MVLVIFLILTALIGIIFGITKKNKVSLIASVVLLIFIITVLLVYSYLYSKNPY
jgi:hypothetical protein